MSPADGGSDARKRTNPPVACLSHFHMLFLQTLAGGMHQTCWWEPTLRPVSSFVYFFFSTFFFFLLLLLCLGLSSIPQDFFASNCGYMKTWFVGENPFKISFKKRFEACYTREIVPSKLRVTHYQFKSWSAPDAPPHHPTAFWPINTSQSPVTDGCRGQRGLGGVKRGFAKVRLGHRGVWDCCDMACLSISVQVDE